MSKTQYFAFKQEYPGLPLRLTTDAMIFKLPSSSEEKKIKVTALWDTGAMRSAITHEIAQFLNLVSVDRVKVNGVNNVSMANVVNISIGLPNWVMVQDVDVTVCSLVKNVDLLIGMDIIQLGDFSISNGDGKTLFTFAIPPFDNKTDLYEKTLAVNKRNKIL